MISYSTKSNSYIENEEDAGDTKPESVESSNFDSSESKTVLYGGLCIVNCDHEKQSTLNNLCFIDILLQGYFLCLFQFQIFMRYEI